LSIAPGMVGASTCGRSQDNVRGRSSPPRHEARMTAALRAGALEVCQFPMWQVLVLVLVVASLLVGTGVNGTTLPPRGLLRRTGVIQNHAEPFGPPAGRSIRLRPCTTRWPLPN